MRNSSSIVLLAGALLSGLAFAAAAAPAPNAQVPAPSRLISLEKCLTVPEAAGDTAQVVLDACGDPQRDQWRLPLRGKIGVVQAVADGRCLDVRGADSSDFTPIILFPCHGQGNQLWRHTLDGRLIGLGDKCLDVQGASGADGTPIILYRCLGQANQRWRAESQDTFDASHLLGGGAASWVASAPTDRRVAYAAVEGGIFRSEDAGATWSPSLRGLEGRAEIEQIAVDPRNAAGLLVVADRRVWRSVDSALTLLPTYGQQAIRHVLWHPQQASKVFALAGAQLLASTDGGRGFAVMSTIGDDARRRFTDLLYLVSPTPALLAASPGCPACGESLGGVWRSVDEGASWTPLLSLPVTRLLTDPRDGRLFALNGNVLQTSADGGASWQPAGSFGAPLIDLWLDPQSAGLWLAAAEDGLWRTSDAGASWSPIETGLRADDAGRPLERIVRFTPTPGGVLAAVDSSELAESRLFLRSVDAGLTWQSAGQHGLTAGSFVDLELAASGAAYAAGGAGVFRSADGGGLWTPLRSVLPGVSYSGIGEDATVPGRLYATASRKGAGPFVWRSDDHGANWQALAHSGGEVETRGFVTVRTGGTDVLVTALVGRFASSLHQGVLRSEDGGASWEPVDIGGRVAQLANGVEGELLAGGAAGIQRSLDGGESWVQLVADPVSALAATGGRAYAVGGDRLWRRLEADAPWESLPMTAAFGAATSLAVSAADSHIVFLGTAQNGLFRSLDAGRSWHAVHAGLPARGVLALAADGECQPWAALDGQGLFHGHFSHDAAQTVGQGRFTIDVRWRDFLQASGIGRPASLTRDTSHFWFFEPDNVELAVKILDGRAINGHYWIFFASLTNVEFQVEVTDRWTGIRRIYVNPAGSFASVGDTTAIPAVVPSVMSSTIPAGEMESSTASTASTASVAAPGLPTLTIDGRFEASVTWIDAQGQSGPGLARPLTADTGYFYFFDPDNVEVLVKILDGRPLNGHFWVFFGGLSNVEYSLRIVDRLTGQVQVYHNPLGQFASVGDTSAF